MNAHVLEHRGGFTLVEMLVVVLFGSLILMLSYRVIATQTRAHTVEAQVTRVQGSLRGAASLLASNLMELSPSEGDVATMSDNSLKVRVGTGGGVVCRKEVSGGASYYGVPALSGNLEAGDSAFVYSVKKNEWSTVALQEVLEGAAALAVTPTCAWGDTVSAPAPEVAVRFAGPSAVVDFVRVGAPVRAFRWVRYELISRNGRYWLAQTVGDAATPEVLTGPLKSPADGGLSFSYFDANGNATATPAQVARISILIRAESPESVSQAGNPLTDSLRISVRLRN